MASFVLRILAPILCVIFAALGIWALADAEYASGAFHLAISAFWLAVALNRDKLLKRIEDRRGAR